MIQRRHHSTFRSLWFWGLTVMVGLFMYPFAINSITQYFHVTRTTDAIAPLFTDQVQYWGYELETWSRAYGIDPNLMATIMQIESCGHPSVVSPAGARGLFQVMPFHFDSSENMIDPYTNAFRSANFIRECTGYADGDVGLTLACYNGGPSVTWRSMDTWAQETQRYYYWGTGIYEDAITFNDDSNRLNEWLRAGGSNLCGQASFALRLR